MSVAKPEDMNPVFAAAYNARDLQRMLALYEPNAKLVQRSGEVAEGLGAIREALQRLLSFNGKVEAHTKYCIVQDGLALVGADWKLTDATKPDGEPFAVSARSAELIRQQPDGSWRLSIDNPFAL